MKELIYVLISLFVVIFAGGVACGCRGMLVGFLSWVSVVYFSAFLVSRLTPEPLELVIREDVFGSSEVVYRNNTFESINPHDVTTSVEASHEPTAADLMPMGSLWHCNWGTEDESDDTRFQLEAKIDGDAIWTPIRPMHGTVDTSSKNRGPRKEGGE